MSSSTETHAPPRGALRRFAAGLVALALGLAGAIVVAAPAYADGAVRGTIVNQANQPVLGLQFDVSDEFGGSIPVTSDLIDGTFEIPGLPTGDYEVYVAEGSQDAALTGYTQARFEFSIGAGDTELGELAVATYVNVSGTITNWTTEMDDVSISVYQKTPSGWFLSGTWLSTDATFNFPGFTYDGVYTLHFFLDLSLGLPYAPAFLGGEFLDPELATPIVVEDGAPVTDVLMEIPAGAEISGRVVDTTGAGLPNVLVFAWDEPGTRSAVAAFTDADGYYTMYAPPGVVHSVTAYELTSTYLPQTYDGFDGCGCLFTPVTPTLDTPATHIDFELVAVADALYLLGDLHEPPFDFDPALLGDELEDVRVHVYRPVTGGWAEVDVVESNSSGEFDIVLPELGAYRLRFEENGTWLAVDGGAVGPGSTSSPDSAQPGCFVDTGEMESAWVDSGVAYYAALTLVPTGGCGAEPAVAGEGPGGTPGGSPGIPKPAKPRSGAVASIVEAASGAVPTPTPAPTPSATPRPSAAPTPAVTDPAEPAPASAPDLWWLLWVGIGLLGVVVIGGVVFFVRRT